MSDGPHRSLNMRRGWKQLAERADNVAFSTEEIRNALSSALADDWREEVPGDICQQLQTILNKGQGFLFSGKKIEWLEALRGESAGYPLCSVLIDCAMYAVFKEHSSDDTLAKVAGSALSERAASGVRQVEEHYHRKSNQVRAVHVRERIEDNIIQSDIAQLAKRLTGLDRTERRHRPVKKTDIDDGVLLS